MNDTFDNPALIQGVVTKKISGSYAVQTNHCSLICNLGPRQKPLETRRAGCQTSPDPLASLTVGDQVQVVARPGQTGQIIAVLPRRNALSRRAAAPTASSHITEQVIAANVDQVVAVLSAASPAPKWTLLDRYLVSAEAAGLPALICLTKIDLVQDPEESLDPEIAITVERYQTIGYPVILVSAVNGQGLLTLRQALQERLSVLIGKSGVGKTSLLNAIQPGLGQRVGAVSRIAGKGRHTTSHLELFPLDFGGALIDTPGTREFGLWDVDPDELIDYFPELRPYKGRCRFGLDCRHEEEPGCAVRKAVMDGQVSPYRYQSYLNLKVDP